MEDISPVQLMINIIKMGILRVLRGLLIGADMATGEYSKRREPSDEFNGPEQTRDRSVDSPVEVIRD